MQLTNAFYYLDNFQRVIDSITERYQDFFNKTEAGFIELFNRLPQVSRALTVRMIMRKPRFFLEERLHYTEIGAAAAALSPLLAAGWVTYDPELAVEEFFALFTKPRVIQILNLPRNHMQLTKNALLECCRPWFPQPQTLKRWSKNCSSRVYRIDVAALCERFRLLYFGNFHQTWSEFVLTDLGLKRFERVDTAQARPFHSRRHWDVFTIIHRCRERLYGDEEPHSVLQEVPPFIEGCEWLESRRQHLLFRVGEAFERKKETAAALAVYGGILHPGAAARAIRIRAATGDVREALSACEAAITANPFDQDALPLRRLRHRLQRRLGMTTGINERHVSDPPIMDLILEQPSPPYSVELQVGDFLMRQDADTQVCFVENSLMNGLFGLLCWRALFAPVEGAFFHPFHRAPADLSDPQFYLRRESVFAECFAELDGGGYRGTILRTFDAKYGIDNPFVVWCDLDKSMMRTALDCICAEHLKSWFGLLARDFQANRCGFPDLIQLWPKDGRYRLIEVKAPGDRLQDNQRRVLQLCASFQMPVAVCKVRWRTHATAASLDR